MSNRYKGAVISATPPTTTGGSSGTASGAWTLEQQMQLRAAGLWPTQPPPPNIEDVFSTYLYTGTGNAETITNGLNLLGKGGLVWVKSRSNTGNNVLNSNTSGGTTTAFNLANTTWTGSSNILDFLSNGFTIKGDFGTDGITLGRTYCTWAFRKQAKFFDVVTYTGTGSNTTIPHSLGSVPGCIIVKSTSGPDVNWAVYHRSLANTQYLVLNSTAAAATGATWWNSTTPTSSVFSVGTDATVNANNYGQTYVAYLFAHDAGGFGLTGTDNVISCGSVTGSQTVNLGYEPQLVISKCAGSTGDWSIVDNMRGAPTPSSGTTPYSNVLVPNTSAAETTAGLTGSAVIFNSTGFRLNPDTVTAATYIYIAIRRGPMAVPTTGTSVFSMSSQANNTTYPYANNFNAGFPPDFAILKVLDLTSAWRQRTRLSGNTYLIFDSTNSEASQVEEIGVSATQNILSVQSTTASASTIILYAMRRAPGFMDTVCYTGTEGVRTVTHNLTVAPELMIVKGRNTDPANSSFWTVYAASMGNTNYIYLNATNATSTFSAYWNNTSPTASVFTLGAGNGEDTNAAGKSYIAYLFATVAGVSKVGSYTGSSSSDVVVDCGFTAGARFVLIKRTDTTGSWYVYDSTRGITASNDPYILTNSSAAQVTNTNYIGPYSTGFYVNTGTPLNATTGANYIFLAIA